MSRLVDIIVVGRQRRPIRVERIRAWSRRDVHAIGLSAVAEATGAEVLPDLSTGALLGDVQRLFARSPGRCPPDFYEARTR